MASRAQQKEDTCERILKAAAEAFAERGFAGASTREIAARAGTNQGLITYHFHSKDELWKAVADRIFGLLRSSLAARLDAIESEDAHERRREAVRQYVRFVAAHPELFRLMVEEGKQSDARTRWLVDKHLKPSYADFNGLARGFVGGVEPDLLPHAYYAFAGAASLMFAVPAECRRLTGLDPSRKAAVQAHAEYLARLFVP